MVINHLVSAISRYIYQYLINPSLEDEEIFAVIFRCSTLNSAIIAAVNFSEIENVELGVEFFLSKLGSLYIFSNECAYTAYLIFFQNSVRVISITF